MVGLTSSLFLTEFQKFLLTDLARNVDSRVDEAEHGALVCHTMCDGGRQLQQTFSQSSVRGLLKLNSHITLHIYSKNRTYGTIRTILTCARKPTSAFA